MSYSLNLQDRLLAQLEGLARRILERKINSVQDMWQFEIDLAKFQLEQQQAMKAERNQRNEVNARLKEVRRAKETGWEVQRQHCQDELEQNKVRVNLYEYANNIARKLGDTVAWIFLDWVQITSLARDSSMRSSDAHRMPEGHGLQGMLAVAEILCNAGAGFPILHDITNCLRIGDITFFTPNNNPLTIEVKTRLKGYQGDKVNLAVKIYSVSSSAEDERWNALSAHMPREIALPQDISVDKHWLQEPLAMDEELKRQLERMEKATMWQSAKDGKPFKVGERTTGIVRHLTSEQNLYHYDKLQDITNDAKSYGFAWRTVDDAFVYTAFYKEKPLWLLESEQFIPEERKEDYQRANISIAFPEPQKNYACVYDIFDSPSFVRPFFLLPLPADTIIDAMCRRLQVFVSANLGKLVAALQSIGLNARLPKNKQELDELFLPVTTEILLPDGRIAYVVFKGGLRLYSAQMTHEFLSLQGFIKLVSSTIELTAEQAKQEEVLNTIFPKESGRTENSQGKENTMDTSEEHS